jgi:methenyltetrahydrofolate cyclohydrolase
MTASAETQEHVGPWLEALASAAPAPGGGAAAAVAAAMGASLVSMVCNLTLGKPKHAAYEAVMADVLRAAEDARRTALQLADDDARAFEGVIAAYKLPRATDAEKAERTRSIQDALAAAAQVPLRTAEVAAEVIRLAGRIVEGANPNVLSDVAVAAAIARAALESAALNVDVNLAAMTDAEHKRALADALRAHEPQLEQADTIVDLVRARIAP